MLKMSLVRHIQTRKAHSQKIRDKEEQERLANAWENKNSSSLGELGETLHEELYIGQTM